MKIYYIKKKDSLMWVLITCKHDPIKYRRKEIGVYTPCGRNKTKTVWLFSYVTVIGGNYPNSFPDFSTHPLYEEGYIITPVENLEGFLGENFEMVL